MYIFLGCIICTLLLAVADLFKEESLLRYVLVGWRSVFRNAYGSFWFILSLLWTSTKESLVLWVRRNDEQGICYGCDLEIYVKQGIVLIGEDRWHIECFDKAAADRARWAKRRQAEMKPAFEQVIKEESVSEPNEIDFTYKDRSDWADQPGPAGEQDLPEWLPLQDWELDIRATREWNKIHEGIWANMTLEESIDEMESYTTDCPSDPEENKAWKNDIVKRQDRAYKQWLNENFMDGVGYGVLGGLQKGFTTCHLVFPYVDRRSRRISIQ